MQTVFVIILRKLYTYIDIKYIKNQKFGLFSCFTIIVPYYWRVCFHTTEETSLAELLQSTPKYCIVSTCTLEVSQITHM